MKKIKICLHTVRLFFAVCLMLTGFCAPLYADNTISMRLGALVDFPVAMPQFKTGIGGIVVLDWAFWSFAKNFSLGAGMSGEFTSIPVKIGDPFLFVEGKLGPFVTYRPFERWDFFAGLYAGIYQLSRDNERYVKALGSVSAGADFRLSPSVSVFAEGGYTFRIFSEGEPFSSVKTVLGLRLNYTELNSGARLAVEKTTQYRVFPVSWAWYEKNPVAVIRINNKEPNTITDVSLSLFLDSYMGRPYVFAQLPRLDSGASAEVPVTALFNEVMLSLIENVNANGVIQVEYRSLGLRKETVFPLRMPIYHRNTMSWDDDRRAAAFVSPHDSAARLFARYVASAVNIYMESASARLSSVPKNVRYAAALFEALRLYGISYVVVPSMSFVNLHANESSLDNLTYPYETLYYRGGDCTYISILYCSLLEALDIETAFITVPGHLFMAFDTGDNNWIAGNANIIELDGRRWLPVEITVPEEGFMRAWRIGAREWRNTGAGAALYPIRECWKTYPSVTVSASVDYPPEMPAGTDIVNAMAAELLGD